MKLSIRYIKMNYSKKRFYILTAHHPAHANLMNQFNYTDIFNVSDIDTAFSIIVI
jgi:hypothetical protein